MKMDDEKGKEDGEEMAHDIVDGQIMKGWADTWELFIGRLR